VTDRPGPPVPPPEAAIVGTFAFVLAVVATPREAIWAFGLYLVVVALVAAGYRLDPRWMARRLVIEVPFVAFALFLPLLGGGERFAVGPASLSTEGTWAAWNVLAKATIGVLAASVLAATTPTVDLLVGCQRLRFPRPLVLIASSMLRYGEVLTAQLRRLQTARVARGDDPRWLGQAAAVAATAGTLFVRSYERGERVHLAMAARGGATGVPDPGERATPGEWLRALAPAAIVGAVAVAAWTVT
jgi:cobalt/nickel transport system permease protein